MEKLLVEGDPGETFVRTEEAGGESDGEGESERQHDKLLNAISSLHSKHKIPSKQRSEPVSSASVFHASGNQDKLQLHELVGAIQSSSSNTDLKKNLNKLEKNDKVLAVPLPKHEKERIERSVAYDKTCTDLKKWDPVVQKNRKADQIQFPLQQPDIRLINNTRQSLKNFQPQTPLEREIATLLHGSDNVLPNNKVLTRAEERALKAMSLEEAKARRAELQKHRALLSYKEAKSKRAKKIKSKRYHRILRKEKLRLEKKTLEELEKTDPEGYIDKLQQLDRQRMQERMNLKHRGGSKFMKKQAVYAKYDDNARQTVQDMIQKNKELTQKIIQNDEDDEEMEANSDDEKMQPSDMTTEDVSNPWMSVSGGKRKSAVLSRPEEIINTEAVIMNAELENMDEEETEERDKDEDNKAGEEEAADSSEKDEEDNKIMKSTQKEYRDIDDIFSKAEQEKQKAMRLERKVKRQMAKEKRERTEAKRLERSEKRRKQQQKLRKAKKSGTKAGDESSEDSDSSEEESEAEGNDGKDEVMKEAGRMEEADELMTSLQRKNKLEDFEGTVDVPKVLTYTPDLTAVGNNKTDNQSTVKKSSKTGNQAKEVRLDPSKFFTVETSVKHSETSALVEVGEEDEMEEEEQQRLTIAQAFASDDIVEEFQAEKQETEERDKPKDIDLSLPGWGEWGGTGVEPSKKKKRRFVIKAPKAPPRKDRNLSNVIISETKDNSITKHQVSQLPFPFTNVHEFQNSIRQPIGRTWVPETSYKDMIQPRVTTKLGTIIDPISKEETFKNSKNDEFNTKTNSDKAKKQPERTGKSDAKNRKRKKQGK